MTTDVEIATPENDLPRFISVEVIWDDGGVPTHVHYLGHSVSVHNGRLCVNYYLPRAGEFETHHIDYALGQVKLLRIS